MSPTLDTGILTVSLDFELYWGTRDHRSLSDYGPNILGGREAIPAMLDLFSEFEIHATWAVVGFLCYDSKDELLEHTPSVLPRYEARELSPYSDIAAIGTAEKPPAYFFAPDLVSRVRETPHQELGSHTFSHYYCLEDGQTPAAFQADLAAMQETARRKLKTELRSLVFPRNQFNEDCLEMCHRSGIRAYRGNQRSWVYEPRKTEDETRARRAIRLLDSYVNLTGHHGHDLRHVPREGPLDVPASRFLRPVAGRFGLFEPLRLRRILNDLTHCAKRGLLYHLWWHPDNFGASTPENLAFLRQILEHYRRLAEDYGMKSLNMGEVAEHVRPPRHRGSPLS